MSSASFLLLANSETLFFERHRLGAGLLYGEVEQYAQLYRVDAVERAVKMLELPVEIILEFGDRPLFAPAVRDGVEIDIYLGIAGAVEIFFCKLQLSARLVADAREHNEEAHPATAYYLAEAAVRAGHEGAHGEAVCAYELEVHLPDEVLYLYEVLKSDDTFRQLSLSYADLKDSPTIQQSLFSTYEDDIKQECIDKTIDNIQRVFGKNAVMRCSSLKDYSTYRQRNNQIGGHRE